VPLGKAAVRGRLSPGERPAGGVGVAILAALLAGAFRLLASTWRIRVRNGATYQALLASGQPFVYACWHGHLLPLLWHHRGCGAVLLISRSRDGDLVARVASHFGYRAIRGSSSRGAASALRELGRELAAGHSVAVMPDGPRGPARVPSPGMVAAAQSAGGAPILCVGCHASPAWHAASWDRTMVPLPFARVTVAYSDPASPTGRTTDDAVRDAPRFGRLLDEATEEASRANNDFLRASPQR
jgi:lysophospholipid acyltransferase (LPLAT)-like uncharacterized protein